MHPRVSLRFGNHAGLSLPRQRATSTLVLRYTTTDSAAAGLCQCVKYSAAVAFRSWTSKASRTASQSKLLVRPQREHAAWKPNRKHALPNRPSEAASLLRRPTSPVNTPAKRSQSCAAARKTLTTIPVSSALYTCKGRPLVCKAHHTSVVRACLLVVPYSYDVSR